MRIILKNSETKELERIGARLNKEIAKTDLTIDGKCSLDLSTLDDKTINKINHDYLGIIYIFRQNNSIVIDITEEFVIDCGRIGESFMNIILQITRFAINMWHTFEEVELNPFKIKWNDRKRNRRNPF